MLKNKNKSTISSGRKTLLYQRFLQPSVLKRDYVLGEVELKYFGIISIYGKLFFLLFFLLNTKYY